jgi:hypothetical protein
VLSHDRLGCTTVMIGRPSPEDLFVHHAPPSMCGPQGSAVAGIRGRARDPKDRLVKSLGG